MAQQPLEIRSSNSPALTPASCCKKELGAWRWKKRDRLAGAGVSGKASREKCSLGFVQTGSKIIETEAHTAQQKRGDGKGHVVYGRQWRNQLGYGQEPLGQELESAEGQAKGLGLYPVHTGNTDCPCALYKFPPLFPGSVLRTPD